MLLCLRTFGVSVLTLISTLLAAQPFGFSLPLINNIQTGAIINPPFRVTNFDSIASLQFVLRWDPAVLRFQEVHSLNLIGLEAEKFVATNALDSGFLRVQYEAPNSLAGATVPDGTNIFRVRFQVIGAPNSGSAIQISEAFPTAFEVTQVQPTSFIQAYGLEVLAPYDSVQITNGFVAVGYIVSTNTPPALHELPVRVSPNPLTEHTTVRFHLEAAALVRMALVDAGGQVVRTEDWSLPAGDHDMAVSAAGLSAHGTYFLTLRTATQACVRPLFMF